MTTRIQFRWFCRLLLWLWIAAMGFLSLPTFAYDGQGQLHAGTKISYDGSCLTAIDYDGVAVLAADECRNHPANARPPFAAFTEFLAADSGAFSAIGLTGKVGEQWLKENLGGQSRVYFKTSQGDRFVDQLANGIANESKVGYQLLTPSIQLQISKDAELLNTRVVQGVNWHFFQSPVTGLGGPSQSLMNALQQNGINVIIQRQCPTPQYNRHSR